MLTKLTFCKPDELDAENRQRWINAQGNNPSWNSPFLHPEFATIVANCRLDALVLIAEDHLSNRAYFAFHRGKGGLSRPIGAPISDYQAVIEEPGFCVPMTEVLNEAGIGALPFTALADPLQRLTNFYTHHEQSHLIDLSDGPDAYFSNQQKQYHKYFKKMRQRTRAAVREHDSAKLVVANADPQLLKILFDWKHDQYIRTGKLDVLNVPWIRALLENCYASPDPDFRALLFGYSLGGKWAAAELGLLSGGVFHSWIAAYDSDFSRNSPGLLLLHEIINQSAGLGIQQIDLGRGHDHYKKYYASELRPLAAGCFISSGPAANRRKQTDAICDGFAKLPLGKLSSAPKKLAGSLEYIGACHPKPREQIRAFGDSILRKLKRVG